MKHNNFKPILIILVVTMLWQQVAMAENLCLRPLAIAERTGMDIKSPQSGSASSAGSAETLATPSFRENVAGVMDRVAYKLIKITALRRIVVWLYLRFEFRYESLDRVAESAKLKGRDPEEEVLWARQGLSVADLRDEFKNALIEYRDWKKIWGWQVPVFAEILREACMREHQRYYGNRVNSYVPAYWSLIERVCSKNRCDFSRDENLERFLAQLSSISDVQDIAIPLFKAYLANVDLETDRRAIGTLRKVMGSENRLMTAREADGHYTVIGPGAEKSEFLANVMANLYSSVVNGASSYQMCRLISAKRLPHRLELLVAIRKDMDKTEDREFPNIAGISERRTSGIYDWMKRDIEEAILKTWGREVFEASFANSAVNANRTISAIGVNESKPPKVAESQGGSPIREDIETGAKLPPPAKLSDIRPGLPLESI